MAIGELRFRRGRDAGGAPGTARARDTAGLVFDAARRLDERAAFGARYPNEEERFVVAREFDAKTLKPENLKVLKAIDGVVSMRAVADRTGGDLFTTAKIVLELEEQGLVRRREWQEYLDLADRLAKAGKRPACGGILRYLESWDTSGNAKPLFDLAERHRQIGDDAAAAGCFAKAAEVMHSVTDLSGAADCLKNAVTLAPRNVEYRARRFDIVKCADPNNTALHYECLRDWLVAAADRADSARAEEMENTILPMVPGDANEEARVGRALGHLGRKAMAVQLLCRAAKRRLQKSGGDSVAASEFHEALRLDKECADAIKGLAKLEGRRNGRRRAGIVVVVGLVGLTVGIAFPIRNVVRDRDQAHRIEQAQEVANQGDLTAALALLDRPEENFSSPEYLASARRLPRA